MKDSGLAYKSLSILGTKCTMRDYSKARIMINGSTFKLLFCCTYNPPGAAFVLSVGGNGSGGLDSKPGPCSSNSTSLIQANMLSYVIRMK